MSLYVDSGKRALDVALATIATVLLAPVLLVAAAAIWIEDRGPVLFRQKRVGRDGVHFTILKFRSMPTGTPDVESRKAADLEVTKVGARIRRWNIDELPQLINVIRGEMSLVGPRPAIPSQIDVLEERIANGSFHLRPGLTGLAQINGFDDMTPAQKARWDGTYASHRPPTNAMPEPAHQETAR